MGEKDISKLWTRSGAVVDLTTEAREKVHENSWLLRRKMSPECPQAVIQWSQNGIWQQSFKTEFYNFRNLWLSQLLAQTILHFVYPWVLFGDESLDLNSIEILESQSLRNVQIRFSSSLGTKDDQDDGLCNVYRPWVFLFIVLLHGIPSVGSQLQDSEQIQSHRNMTGRGNQHETAKTENQIFRRLWNRICPALDDWLFAMFKFVEEKLLHAEEMADVSGNWCRRFRSTGRARVPNPQQYFRKS